MREATPRRVTRHVVATTDALPPGSRTIVVVAGRSIGVFNVDGRYFAVRNRCPHQGGPLCLGSTGPMAKAIFEDGAAPRVEVDRHGEILKCPWHGWEFDLATGEAVFGDGVHVARYRAYVEKDGVPGCATETPPPVETYKTITDGGNVIVEVPG